VAAVTTIDQPSRMAETLGERGGVVKTDHSGRPDDIPPAERVLFMRKAERGHPHTGRHQRRSPGPGDALNLAFWRRILEEE